MVCMWLPAVVVPAGSRGSPTALGTSKLFGVVAHLTCRDFDVTQGMEKCPTGSSLCVFSAGTPFSHLFRPHFGTVTTTAASEPWRPSQSMASMQASRRMAIKEPLKFSGQKSEFVSLWRRATTCVLSRFALRKCGGCVGGGNSRKYVRQVRHLYGLIMNVAEYSTV